MAEVAAPAPDAAVVEEGPSGPEGPSADELTRPAYTEEETAKILAFFKKREKNPVGFTYTAEGNLETKEGAAAGKKRKPEPAGTIQLKRFVPIDATERAILEEARKDTLAELDIAYEAARDTLRTAWEEYRRTGEMRGVLEANQSVTELDARRSAVRAAVRSISVQGNPVTSKVLLSLRNEKRKLFDTQKDPFQGELYLMSYWDYRPEHEFGKYVPEEAAAAEMKEAEEEEGAIRPEETSYRTKLKDGRIARIFFETDSEFNSFLSPGWGADFVLDSVKYACPLQAYEAERARELNKLELRTSLLKTRSGRTIRMMVRKVEGHPADARGLWFKIYTALYQQHPELKEKLLATGTDALVYAEPREGPSGIGLGDKDSAALDPAKWKGENLCGLAQETVRTRLREESLEEAPEGEAKEQAITEEEQAKAKVGAIINARRNAGAGAP